MSILVDKKTRVLVQGITGKEGAFHAARCKEYGSQVVGGVTPGKGGTTHEGFAVWNTVEEATKATGADCALIFVPPPAAADAIMEAADAGMPLIVCITEGVPVADMVRVKAFLARTSSRLIGHNCPGLITTGQAKIGIIPRRTHKIGHVCVVSRGASLIFEALYPREEKGRLRRGLPLWKPPDSPAVRAQPTWAQPSPAVWARKGRDPSAMPVQRTLTIIKPDAVAKGVAGQIIARFEKAGLKVLAAKLVHLSAVQAGGLHIVHNGPPIYARLRAVLPPGACMAIVLEGENAIARLRELMGATDPAKADTGTIRKDFASSIEANAVHGSDSAESAAFEIPYFFGALEIFAR